MKLLTRTVTNYILFSTLLVIICTPLFYFSIQTLFTKELDESLRAHKADFYESMSHLKNENDIEFYHLMNKEYSLMPAKNKILRDTLFTQEAFDRLAGEVAPHRVLITGITLNGKDYQLRISESLVNSKSLIKAIMLIQVLMLIVMLTGFVLINRKLAKVIWGPFYTILDQLKKYQIDKDNTLQLPQSSTAEFRDLSEAITLLVSKNQEAYLSQKEFTENASHELQTPLAIFRSKLELLSQSNELTQEQADLIGTLADATDRISRLNKNLLLLSKIENRQFLDQEEVDLSNVITKSLNIFSKQTESKNIQVQRNTLEPMLIKANPILVEVLIGNLISNALRHVNQEGRVDISVNQSSISISNTGVPLQFPEKIFQRFHRESKSMGSGLGLAIVRKICDVANYTIQYKYDRGMHQFTISF